MRIGIQTLELQPIVVALGAEEKVVAVLTHPALLQYLSFTVETFITFALLDLGLEYHLKLMIWLVTTHQAVERGRRTLEITFLTLIVRYLHRLRLLQVEQLKYMPMIGF